MAEGREYFCSRCRRKILAWDEGNPYYVDASGKKRYAYHPNPERELCTGNDSDYLCLECGRKFKADSELPDVKCPKCNSSSVTDTWQLEDKPCPYCCKGKFKADTDSFIVS